MSPSITRRRSRRRRRRRCSSPRRLAKPTRIRLGALLFLLPLYHPFRLLEELQMLDNLSNGRLDIGVGRGVSPFEFAALGEDIKESDAALRGVPGDHLEGA